MAAAATMDHHDRRLSVCKTSSSKISKPPSASSRPPATVVSADLTNFRRVVQQLTGTPPPSASSSPVHDSSLVSRSSRLQRIAPPPLRDILPQQDQQIQQPLHQKPLQQVPNLPPLQHPHHHHMQPDGAVQDQPRQHDLSWLSSAGLFSPPLLHTQVSNLNQNPDSSLNGCINPWPHPNPNPPHPFSALPAPASSDSMWANRLHATPSPRPLSNFAASAGSLLPLASVSGEDLESGSGHGRREAFEWPALSVPASNGHLLLPYSSNGQALLGTSSIGNPQHSSSSSSNEQFLLGPSPKGHPLLPPPPAALIPLSPSTTCFNPWLPPWPPSPFLPLPFSPGLGPLSPGFGPLISSPGGFSFYGTNDYP